MTTQTDKTPHLSLLVQLQHNSDGSFLSPLAAAISTMASSSRKQVANWLELPADLIYLIFTKVGTVDILESFQYVCSTWRELCKEPRLFSTIDISHDDMDELSEEKYAMMVGLSKEAVNRSSGELVHFCIQHFATDEILECIIQKKSPLKSLVFASCGDISVSVVMEMAKKLPLLELLEFHYCDLESPIEVLETYGRHCPLLESLTLNYWNYSDVQFVEGDYEAEIIAKTMPKLRRLDLSETYVTDYGLQIILDGCPLLNFIDISECLNLTFPWDLVKICVEKNITLRLLDEDSIFKAITQMHQHFWSLSEEHFKAIQKADPETRINTYKFILEDVAKMETMLNVMEANITLGWTPKLVVTLFASKEETFSCAQHRQMREMKLMAMVHMMREKLEEMAKSCHCGCGEAAKHEPTP